MPCRDDYLMPTKREAELQRAAKLYVYVLEQLLNPVPAYVSNAAEDLCCKDNQPLLELCDTLRSLKRKNKKTFESIVYNAKNPTSRDLANWWEEHRAADLKRMRDERAAKRKAVLRKSALKKLTKAEKAALGV